MNLTPPIEYVIARGPLLPPYSGKLYEYVLAGNGLWKRAANAHLVALVPVIRFVVPGLAGLEPAAALPRTGKVPLSHLLAMLEDGRRMARRGPVEGMWQVVTDEDRLRVWRPRQVGGVGALGYAGEPPGPVVADVHSHHQMTAAFSPTDSRDEQGFRFYAVLGRIFTAPEVRVRVGVWGTYWHCPATTLFESLGPVIDARRHA